MSRQIPVTLTNMCMVYDGDKVLVQNRVDPDWPGITFPGGHVESGESFCASVIREVFEETGLTIENPRLCGVKEWENQDGSRYIVMLYKTNNFSGKLHDSAEGPVFWATREEILSMQMTEHFDKMMEIFFREDLSEFYYQKTTNSYTIQLL